MSFVTYEQDGYVGVITINRPEALNALNVQVLKDLDAVIDNINLDETRAVIVTGAGEKAFVAGADIAAMSTMTVKEGREFGKFGNDIFRKLESLIFCVRYLRRLSITILQRVCNCAVHPFQMRRLFRTALVHILSHRWSRLAVFGRGDPEALFKNIAEVIRLRIAHFPSNYIRLIIRRV